MSDHADSRQTSRHKKTKKAKKKRKAAESLGATDLLESQVEQQEEQKQKEMQKKKKKKKELQVTEVVQDTQPLQKKLEQRTQRKMGRKLCPFPESKRTHHEAYDFLQVQLWSLRRARFPPQAQRPAPEREGELKLIRSYGPVQPIKEAEVGKAPKSPSTQQSLLPSAASAAAKWKYHALLMSCITSCPAPLADLILEYVENVEVYMYLLSNAGPPKPSLSTQSYRLSVILCRVRPSFGSQDYLMTFHLSPGPVSPLLTEGKVVASVSQTSSTNREAPSAPPAPPAPPAPSPFGSRSSLSPEKLLRGCYQITGKKVRSLFAHYFQVPPSALALSSTDGQNLVKILNQEKPSLYLVTGPRDMSLFHPVADSQVLFYDNPDHTIRRPRNSDIGVFDIHATAPGTPLLRSLQTAKGSAGHGTPERLVLLPPSLLERTSPSSLESLVHKVHALKAAKHPFTSHGDDYFSHEPVPLSYFDGGGPCFPHAATSHALPTAPLTLTHKQTRALRNYLDQRAVRRDDSPSSRSSPHPHRPQYCHDLKLQLSREEFVALVPQGALALQRLERLFAPYVFNRLQLRRVEASAAAAHQTRNDEAHQGHLSAPCINFHLDTSQRTMQIPLNSETEYVGGRLVFVTDAPVRYVVGMSGGEEGVRVQEEAAWHALRAAAATCVDQGQHEVVRANVVTGDGTLGPAGLCGYYRLVVPRRMEGSFTLHNNTIVHGVTPLLSGTRYSLFLQLDLHHGV